MTPYTPRTVWASPQPAHATAKTAKRPAKVVRAYGRDQPSRIAMMVLDYARKHPGTPAQDIRRALDISSIHRLLNTLLDDGLVTTNMRTSKLGRPLKCVWVKGTT